MAKYKIEIFYYKDIQDKISSTRFQRSVVWNEKKQKALIETIKRGLPIGAILLTKKKNDDKYLVVDGLQRITTIRRYNNEKMKFVDENEVGTDDILGVINNHKVSKDYYNKYNQAAKDTVVEEVRSIILKHLKKSSGLEDFKLAGNIVKELIDSVSIFDLSMYPEINEAVSAIIRDINDLLDVDKIQIPAIIFEGTDSEMSDIFQKLNSEGVSLSKYDIFSANWQDCQIDCKHDKDVLEYVKQKYTQTAIMGLEIDGYDENELFETGIINTYEYAYAIGKALSEKSHFIYTSKKTTDIDSIGFTLLAAIFGISNKDMSDLGKVMDGSKLDFSQLKTKIIYALNVVEKALQNWLLSLNDKYLNSHSDFQLASYIITSFKLHFKIEDDKIIDISKENRNFIHDFRTHLHKHYLYDTLRSFWSGTGDTKLDDLVLKDVRNRRYVSNIPMEHFESTLSTWLDEENTNTRKNFNNEAKIFINYLTAKKVNRSDYQNTNFDYDHVVPKARFSKFTNFGLELAISSPCNVVLMPSFDNRSKREYTYYELKERKNTAIELNEEKLNSFSYPTREELRFVESDISLTLESYKNFLDNRKKYLVNEFIRLFY